MEIRKILFPTDFSEGSAVAIPYVVDMAKRYNAKLFLLHVIYDIAKTSGWYVPHISMDELYKDIELGAKKQLEGCCLEELRGHDIERIVIKGVPDEEVIKLARERGADLIIMGTHSRKGLDRVFFGSTAAKVVRHAPCPVLTVRLPEK